MPQFTSDSATSLQNKLSADPKYLALKATFQRTQAPLDWAALTQYVNSALDTGSNRTRYAVQVNGQGEIKIQDRDNPWTSPATWGPIAVGAAGGIAALTAIPSAGASEAAGLSASSVLGEGAGVSAGTTAALTSGASAAAGGTEVAGSTAASGAGWFSPTNIIPSAIQGIASIFGANQQANASSEAAQLQYKSTEEALADARKQREYEQQQYANYLGRLQPYLGLGTSAGSTLQNLLARSPYAKLANNGPLPQYSTAPLPTTVTPMPPVPQGTQGPYGATPPSGPQGPGTQMQSQQPVTLRAPDGSTKQVQPWEADHYLKAGAVAV